jgi:hypothetical protein
MTRGRRTTRTHFVAPHCVTGVDSAASSAVVRTEAVWRQYTIRDIGLIGASPGQLVHASMRAVTGRVIAATTPMIVGVENPVLDLAAIVDDAFLVSAQTWRTLLTTMCVLAIARHCSRCSAIHSTRQVRQHRATDEGCVMC